MCDESNKLHSAANGVGYIRRLSYGDIVHIDGLPYKYVGDSYLWTRMSSAEVRTNEVGAQTSTDEAVQESKSESVQCPTDSQWTRVPQWMIDQIAAEREYTRACETVRKAQAAVADVSRRIQQAKCAELVWRHQQMAVAKEAVAAAEQLSKV